MTAAFAGWNAEPSQSAASNQATSGQAPATASDQTSASGRAAADTLAVESQTFQTTELDLPESAPGMLLLLSGLAVLFWLTIRMSLRDSRFLRPLSRAVLLIPRLLVLCCLLFILLNPQSRTQLSRTEKSRVGLLIDTSLSMKWPATDGSGNNSGEPPVSRAQSVQQQLIRSGVLSELSRTHVVSVYTFDETLRGPWAVVSDGEVRFVDEHGGQSKAAAADAVPAGTRVSLQDEQQQPSGAPESAAALEQWQRLLEPQGAETRLGEAVYQLTGQLSGRTLAGLVVVTDGRGNAGLEPEAARLRAQRTETRLIAAGVGSLKPQLNLWVAGMQSPLDVHQGDPFDISVSLQGAAAGGQSALVRLFQQTAGGDGSDRRQIAEQTVDFPAESLPVTARFTQTLAVPGRYDFVARVESGGGIVEMTLEDNERRRTVEVTDQKMRVLVISSGPMRDYQFVRNTLYRHSGVESDVWLQSVQEDNAGMVSQEARRLLTKFPETEAELFEYDVVVAFDPDWSRLTTEQQRFLNRWVSEHAGGLVIVAGEIFTPKLAENSDAARDISVLYPVLLSRQPPAAQQSVRAEEAWPVLPTPEGRVAEFLKIADDSGNASIDLWKNFRGIYRSYPVRGLRDGAVVLLQYDNPRARTELGVPPFLVSQFYGAGRSVFLGSAETWRLREISPQGHQRFWTSLIREAGQGRRSRGRARGLLLLDRTEANPGQLVTIRASLLNAQLQPLVVPDAAITITGPDGQTVPTPDRMTADSRGGGQYSAGFRPDRPGQYRISVPVPESSDVLQGVLEVVLPGLESLTPVQDPDSLAALTRETDGRYLPIAEIATLPSLLKDQSQPVIVDEQLRTLWDRQWLLYAATLLLAFEWAMRRVWRLS